MRLLIVSLIFANAALVSAIDPASAQSPNSYPWCARGGDRTNYNSCYFTSKQQCMTTTSGIGAFCFENPEYRRSARAATRPRTHAVRVIPDHCGGHVEFRFEAPDDLCGAGRFAADVVQIARELPAELLPLSGSPMRGGT